MVQKKSGKSQQPSYITIGHIASRKIVDDMKEICKDSREIYSTSVLLTIKRFSLK